MLHRGENRLVKNAFYPKTIGIGIFVGSGDYLFYAGLKFFDTPCISYLLPGMLETILQSTIRNDSGKIVTDRPFRLLSVTNICVQSQPRFETN